MNGVEPGRTAEAGEDAELAAELVIDARGTRCPMPVILAARAATTLAAGTVIQVLATDPAAAADLPAWCRMRGHTVIGIEHADGLVGCRIRLGG